MPALPRVTWLLDSNEPYGVSVMTLRRAAALLGRVSSEVRALRMITTKWPDTSRFRRIEHVAELGRPDVLVTSSPRTLGWATERDTGAPIVHFVGSLPEIAFADETFMGAVGAAARVVVPFGTDADEVAQVLDIARTRVSHHDDFTMPEDVVLSSATNPVIVAAGRLHRDAGLLDLVSGFALAAENLVGWQLRIYGRGPLRFTLDELIRELRQSESVYLMGPADDLSLAYGEASIAVHLATGDAIGLPVYEALSAGVPVIGHRAVPAVGRKVVPDRNGIVLDRSDPVQIAAALSALAEPTTREVLASGARSMDCGLLRDETVEALHRVILSPLRPVAS